MLWQRALLRQALHSHQAGCSPASRTAVAALLDLGPRPSLLASPTTLTPTRTFLASAGLQAAVTAMHSQALHAVIDNNVALPTARGGSAYAQYMRGVPTGAFLQEYMAASPQAEEVFTAWKGLTRGNTSQLAAAVPEFMATLLVLAPHTYSANIARRLLQSHVRTMTASLGTNSPALIRATVRLTAALLQMGGAVARETWQRVLVTSSHWEVIASMRGTRQSAKRRQQKAAGKLQKGKLPGGGEGLGGGMPGDDARSWFIRCLCRALTDAPADVSAALLMRPGMLALAATGMVYDPPSIVADWCRALVQAGTDASRADAPALARALVPGCIAQMIKLYTSRGRCAALATDSVPCEPSSTRAPHSWRAVHPAVKALALTADGPLAAAVLHGGPVIFRGVKPGAKLEDASVTNKDVGHSGLYALLLGRLHGSPEGLYGLLARRGVGLADGSTATANDILMALSATADTLQRRLLVALLGTHTAARAAYMAQFPLSVEPRCTQAWLQTVTLLCDVLAMPPHTHSQAAQDADGDGDDGDDEQGELGEQPANAGTAKLAPAADQGVAAAAAAARVLAQCAVQATPSGTAAGVSAGLTLPQQQLLDLASACACPGVLVKEHLTHGMQSKRLAIVMATCKLVQATCAAVLAWNQHLIKRGAVAAAAALRQSANAQLPSMQALQKAVHSLYKRCAAADDVSAPLASLDRLASTMDPDAEAGASSHASLLWRALAEVLRAAASVAGVARMAAGGAAIASRTALALLTACSAHGQRHLQAITNAGPLAAIPAPVASALFQLWNQTAVPLRRAGAAAGGIDTPALAPWLRGDNDVDGLSPCAPLSAIFAALVAPANPAALAFTSQLLANVLERTGVAASPSAAVALRHGTAPAMAWIQAATPLFNSLDVAVRGATDGTSAGQACAQMLLSIVRALYHAATLPADAVAAVCSTKASAAPFLRWLQAHEGRGGLGAWAKLALQADSSWQPVRVSGLHSSVIAALQACDTALQAAVAAGTADLAVAARCNAAERALALEAYISQGQELPNLTMAQPSMPACMSGYDAGQGCPALLKHVNAALAAITSPAADLQESLDATLRAVVSHAEPEEGQPPRVLLNVAPSAAAHACRTLALACRLVANGMLRPAQAQQFCGYLCHLAAASHRGVLQSSIPALAGTGGRAAPVPGNFACAQFLWTALESMVQLPEHGAVHLPVLACMAHDLVRARAGLVHPAEQDKLPAIVQPELAAYVRALLRLPGATVALDALPVDDGAELVLAALASTAGVGPAALTQVPATIAAEVARRLLQSQSYAGAVRGLAASLASHQGEPGAEPMLPLQAILACAAACVDAAPGRPVLLDSSDDQDATEWGHEVEQLLSRCYGVVVTGQAPSASTADIPLAQLPVALTLEQGWVEIMRRALGMAAGATAKAAWAAWHATLRQLSSASLASSVDAMDLASPLRALHSAPGVVDAASPVAMAAATVGRELAVLCLGTDAQHTLPVLASVLAHAAGVAVAAMGVLCTPVPRGESQELTLASGVLSVAADTLYRATRDGDVRAQLVTAWQGRSLGGTSLCWGAALAQCFVHGTLALAADVREDQYRVQPGTCAALCGVVDLLTSESMLSVDSRELGELAALDTPWHAPLGDAAVPAVTAGGMLATLLARRSLRGVFVAKAPSHVPSGDQWAAPGPACAAAFPGRQAAGQLAKLIAHAVIAHGPGALSPHIALAIMACYGASMSARDRLLRRALEVAAAHGDIDLDQLGWLWGDAAANKVFRLAAAQEAAARDAAACTVAEWLAATPLATAAAAALTPALPAGTSAPPVRQQRGRPMVDWFFGADAGSQGFSALAHGRANMHSSLFERGLSPARVQATLDAFPVYRGCGEEAQDVQAGAQAVLAALGLAPSDAGAAEAAEAAARVLSHDLHVAGVSALPQFMFDQIPSVAGSALAAAARALDRRAPPSSGLTSRLTRDARLAVVSPAVVYDPAWILPAAAWVLSCGTSSPRRWVTSGALCMAVAALSSARLSTRGLAYGIVGGYTEEALSERVAGFKERPQVALLLSALRNSVQAPLARLPGVVTGFASAALQVLCEPGHPMWSAVNSFLLKRPDGALPLDDLPTWLHAVQSAHSAESAKAALQWMVQHMLRRAVVCGDDFRAWNRRHVPQLLQALAMDANRGVSQSALLTLALAATVQLPAGPGSLAPEAGDADGELGDEGEADDAEDQLLTLEQEQAAEHAAAERQAAASQAEGAQPDMTDDVMLHTAPQGMALGLWRRVGGLALVQQHLSAVAVHRARSAARAEVAVRTLGALAAGAGMFIAEKEHSDDAVADSPEEVVCLRAASLGPDFVGTLRPLLGSVAASLSYNARSVRTEALEAATRALDIVAGIAVWSMAPLRVFHVPAAATAEPAAEAGARLMDPLRNTVWNVLPPAEQIVAVAVAVAKHGAGVRNPAARRALASATLAACLACAVAAVHAPRLLASPVLVARQQAAAESLLREAATIEQLARMSSRLDEGARTLLMAMHAAGAVAPAEHVLEARLAVTTIVATAALTGVHSMTGSAAWVPGLPSDGAERVPTLAVLPVLAAQLVSLFKGTQCGPAHAARVALCAGLLHRCGQEADAEQLQRCLARTTGSVALPPATPGSKRQRQAAEAVAPTPKQPTKSASKKSTKKKAKRTAAKI